MRNGAILAPGQGSLELPQSKRPLLVSQNPVVDVEEDQAMQDITANAPEFSLCASHANSTRKPVLQKDASSPLVSKDKI